MIRSTWPPANSNISMLMPRCSQFPCSSAEDQGVSIAGTAPGEQLVIIRRMNPPNTAQ